MSFLKNIVNLVTEDDGKGDESPQPKPNKDKSSSNVAHPLDNTQVQPTLQSINSTSHISVGITDDDKERYKNYFDKLFAGLNDTKPSYHEFKAMIESVNGDSNAPILYPAIFGGFKIQGLTKDVLLSTANNTLQAVKDDAEHFNGSMQNKLNTDVAAKKKTVEDKRQQIINLQQEVTQLNSEIEESETKINNNISIYNTYSQDLISKIEKDIKTIDDNIKQ